jgi:hypothetical protein
MLTNEHIVTLLKKQRTLISIYDRELERIANMNNGRFKLDDNTVHYVSLKAITQVLEREVDVSLVECVSLFDLIERGN